MIDEARTKAPKKMVYLNPRFTVKEYDWGVFVGPRAGEPAKDFTLTDFNGNEIRLSAYKGKWVVLETASATCSMYVKNIEGMRQLREEFPDVEFLLVYVREAHPGERLGQHKSFDEKFEAAHLLPSKYKEDRKVLIDTLDGDMHRAYGVMPNVVYIIRPDGTVHYRCNWATVDGVREALADRTRLHTHENADMHKLKASRGLFTALKVMWTGGAVALWDFFVATPKLLHRHKMVDEYYDKHGRFQNTPNEPTIVYEAKSSADEAA